MTEITSLLLSPHNDDSELFAAWTTLRYRPHVIVCLKSAKQRAFGIEANVRESETARALWWLGDPTWEQWQFPDDAPDWDAVFDRMASWERAHPDLERVFAPAVEKNGHEQHSEIGDIAAAVFGDRVTFYATYTRTEGRTITAHEVPFETSWIWRKLRALSCYESQHGRETGTETWFLDAGLREYVT